eukprot:Sdes_comp16914_c0_seq2m6128
MIYEHLWFPDDPPGGIHRLGNTLNVSCEELDQIWMVGGFINWWLKMFISYRGCVLRLKEKRRFQSNFFPNQTTKFTGALIIYFTILSEKEMQQLQLQQIILTKK